MKSRDASVEREKPRWRTSVSAKLREFSLYLSLGFFFFFLRVS